jgi:hypothetical protein
VTTGSFGSADLLAAGATTVLNSLEQFPDWYTTARSAMPSAGRGGSR